MSREPKPPAPVASRTFFRDKDGVRQFFDVTWSGPEVESVSGRLGSLGKAHSKTFANESARDAWLEERIAKAVREGFVEGDPASPAEVDPEAERAEARRVARLLEKHVVSAYFPTWVGDDARDASKVGGSPWLESEWPCCAACAHPLRFMLQLRRDETPAPFRWAFQGDFVQLFRCETHGTGHVRHPKRVGPPTALAKALPAEVMDLGWVLPAHRIGKYVEHRELPVASRLEPEVQALLATRRSLQCDARTKLGGAPAFSKTASVPSCPSCAKPMRHLFQLSADGPLDLGVGGWLFQCDGCTQGAFVSAG